MKSILSNDKKCYVCGTPYNLHRHHIFFGNGIRPLAEKHGCWVYLCAGHHNMSMCGVHNDRVLDLKLKRECQEVFEKTHTREEFRKLFNKSYL